MRKLSEQEIEWVLSLLREGKPLPEDYKTILFDTKKEYELIYADKEREVDILADTMAVPLQPVKTFCNGEDGNGWTNMLIFGDNLQSPAEDFLHFGKILDFPVRFMPQVFSRLPKAPYEIRRVLHFRQYAKF